MTAAADTDAECPLHTHLGHGGADHLVTSPSLPIQAYRDGFGNWCNRIVAPAEQMRLSANAIVKDTGEPEFVASDAQQHAVEDLPDETLVFLLGS